MTRKFTALMLILLPALGAVAQSTDGQPAPQTVSIKTKSKTPAGKPVPRTVSFAEFQQMQQMLAEQQKQIRQLQQELEQRDQQQQQRLVDLQKQANEARTRAETAVTSSGQYRQALAEVQSTVTDLQTTAAKASAALPPQDEAVKKKVEDLEHPTAIHFRGVTITPGGFIEAAGIWRNHNENGSVNSPAGDFNIPLEGTTNAHMNEFRFDARQSRITLLGEGKIGGVKASGYYEADFLGAAPTANENQSNSFNLRQRQLWAQAAFDNGLTFTGGQQWSLFTLSRKGIANRAEWIPLTINAQYVIGYDWARQAGLRVVKNFQDKVWAGLAIENSSTVNPAGTGFNVASTPLGPIFGFASSPNAQAPGGGLFTLSNTPGANGVSTNMAPDVVAKIAFEPGWGHFEIKGMARFFRDRVGGVNNDTFGGGVGVGAVLPVVKSKVDIIAEGMVGDGMGRYGSGGGVDVTLRPDMSVVPLRAYHALVGPEIHVGKNLDVYAYAGEEYYARVFYQTGAATGVGYGSPFVNNLPCVEEQLTSTALAGCPNQTRYAYEVTPGFWYRFYKGPAGTVQWGMQYSYSERVLWQGAALPGTTAKGFQPKGVLSQVYTSFRYYLP